MHSLNSTGYEKAKSFGIYDCAACVQLSKADISDKERKQLLDRLFMAVFSFFPQQC